MNELTHLDLCTGLGGFSLAAEWAGFQTIGFAEVDPYCCRLLAELWPSVPNFGDVRRFQPSSIGDVFLLTAGYPCQPFSHAGKRKGKRDDRHLWPTLRDLLPHLRPTWLCFENVVGHLSLGLDDVLADLESLGYTAQPIIIPACAVGARHRRDRIWILAHHNGSWKPQPRRLQQEERGWFIDEIEINADASGEPSRPRLRPIYKGNRAGTKIGRGRLDNDLAQGPSAHIDQSQRGSRSGILQQGKGPDRKIIAHAAGKGLSTSQQRRVSTAQKMVHEKMRPTSPRFNEGGNIP